MVAAAVAVVALLLACAAGSVDAKLPLKDCTIIKNPAPLPKVGVVCANPARPVIIAQEWFDSYETHTDFRGFQVYTGTYKGKKMFAANTGLGGPAAAFLVEELIAHGVEVIIRLGTTDLNVTEAAIHNIYVMESVRGLWGIPRDYGAPSDTWGDAIPADTELFSQLLAAGKANTSIVTIKGLGYSIDAFYSFLDPPNVADSPAVVDSMIKAYDAQGCNARDMETASVLFLGKLRGIKTASVLQAVVKSGPHHANPGTTGIPVVLSVLEKHAEPAD